MPCQASLHHALTNRKCFSPHHWQIQQCTMLNPGRARVSAQMRSNALSSEPASRTDKQKMLFASPLADTTVHNAESGPCKGVSPDAKQCLVKRACITH